MLSFPVLVYCVLYCMLCLAVLYAVLYAVPAVLRSMMCTFKLLWLCSLSGRHVFCDRCQTLLNFNILELNSSMMYSYLSLLSLDLRRDVGAFFRGGGGLGVRKPSKKFSLVLQCVHAHVCLCTWSIAVLLFFPSLSLIDVTSSERDFYALQEVDICLFDLSAFPSIRSRDVP